MLETLNVLFVIFFISSVLGWAFEVILCTILDWKKRQKVAYRGFLLGPYCPIYGFFAVLILPALAVFHIHPVLAYLAIVFFATAFELAVATILERIFKLKWWDYSDMYKINYQGKVALVPSLFWGVVGLGFYVFLYPMMLSVANEIYAKFGIWLSLGVMALMVVDGATTIARLTSFKQFVQRMGKTGKNKEIDMDKYVAFMISSIKNNFIFSIKRFVAKTVPHADISFLKIDIWPKKRRKKPSKPQKTQ
jgi:uncharacterized membrane protein